MRSSDWTSRCGSSSSSTSATCCTGDLGTSFAQYPASVNSLIGQALPWSIALQLPAILDRLDRRQHPRRGRRLQGRLGRPRRVRRLAVPLEHAVLLPGDHPALPGRGEDADPPDRRGVLLRSVPELSAAFFGDAITYWWLPFWSLVLVFIGGQAVGHAVDGHLRARLGLRQLQPWAGSARQTTVRYIFRNAMLPQITGLALSIAGMVGGAPDHRAGVLLPRSGHAAVQGDRARATIR